MDGTFSTGGIGVRSEMPGRIIGFGYDNGRDEGDSGEELGEVSVMEVVSNVEMVVVGEDSVDSDGIEDDTLSRCSNESGGSVAEALLLVADPCRDCCAAAGR